jgi:cyclic pyranopterin phosphate synthase
MKLIRSLVEIPGIRDIHITTNGVLTAPFVPELKALGIASVNLSLDALDRERFRIITRRDAFDRVMKCFESLLLHEIPFKINTVVMQDRNIEDIIPLATLTREYPIDVRFIEEMPFNGEGTHYPVLAWTHTRILDHLRSHFPGIYKIPDPKFATANHYHIPGHHGRIGIIAAFTRTFCGTCNRIRVTAQGRLRTCLYDDGTVDLKSLLRSTTDNQIVTEALLGAFRSRALDGFEAEARRKGHLPATESMSTIGG